MTADTYQIFAVRYAHHHRLARESFLAADPHDDSAMPLDYFVWAIVGENRTLILDTGFDKAMAKKRRREFLRPPRDGLLTIGVDPATVGDVINSHMHYDHAGNSDLHHVGGRTAGLQVTRVNTQRGWVVLAADASHFYANFEQMRAYATVYNVGDMLEGFVTVNRLASSPAHVIPGHDPLVLRRYPAPKPELEGIAVRLDVDPRG